MPENGRKTRENQDETTKKKEDTKSSCDFLSKLYDKSIVVRAGSGFSQ
jgi:hypothetical protein